MKDPISEAVHKALLERDAYTLQVLEAEFEEWNAVNANTPCEIHIRVALRGAIACLMAAYKMRAPAFATLFLSAVLFGAACSGNRPPSPPVPPTPAPKPSMALHVQRGRLVTSTGDPRILGPIVGCQIDGVLGWPLVCDEALDAIKSNGLDWSHVRTGPFTAEAEAPAFAFYEKAASGKYDLTRIRQGFLTLLRSKAQGAKDRGIYLEVDIPGDRWPVQHKVSPWQKENNVQGEEHGGLSIFQSAPDAVHQAAIRAVVTALCDLDNVIFSTGNEAFKSASPAWEKAVVAIIRECATPHMVGANSVEGAPFTDFTIIHQSQASAGGSKPMEVNEYAEDIPPSTVIDEALKADAAGTYFQYWKGSHSLAEWNDTMAKLGQIRAGHPPPPTPGCSIPAVEVPQITPRPGSPKQIDARNAFVDEAEAAVKAAHPEMFTGDSLRGWPSDGSAQSAFAQPYFNLLVDYFRGKGACAQAEEDSVMVGWNGDGWYEENHVLAFGTGTPIDGRHAFRNTWEFPK